VNFSNFQGLVVHIATNFVVNITQTVEVIHTWRPSKLLKKDVTSYGYN